MGAAPMARPDTAMSRGPYDRTYSSPRRDLSGESRETQSFDAADSADHWNDADRFQQAKWQEEVRLLYKEPDASWTTRWLSRSLFIFGLLAIGTTAFYAFFGQNRDRSREGELIARPERALAVATPARLMFSKQSGAANEPLPLGIYVQGGTGGETVILLGLPDTTELSLGAQVSAGWAVLARDLEGTSVMAPPQFSGTMQVVVALQSADGFVLDRGTQELEWIAKKQDKELPKSAPPTTSLPERTSVAISSNEPQLDAEQAAALTARGQDVLRTGDIVTARLLLSRAARAGSASAALELGMSYDPAFLRQLGVMGFSPDIATAREWYERASVLGSNEARQYLNRLAQTSPPRALPAR